MQQEFDASSPRDVSVSCCIPRISQRFSGSCSNGNCPSQEVAQLHHRHKPRIVRDVKPARRTLEEFGCHVQNHTLKIEFGQ